MGDVTLVPYTPEYGERLLEDIIAFWKTHNATATRESAGEDLACWTADGHELYIILAEGESAGFLHLGSRGAGCDWLEDVFVREDLRCRGIGGRAIELAWELLRERGMETMYLEVVPANDAAMRLYHRLGFTNLNTLTLNRSVKEKTPIGQETVRGLTFQVYRPN